MANGQAGSGSGIVESVVAGTNVTVDDTDPANPIVSSSGGGGGASGLVYDALNSDQILSATPATLCSVTLGTAGKYLVNIRVCEDLANITAMTTPRRSYFYLSLSGDGTLNSSIFNGTRTSTLAAAIDGITLHTTGISFIIEPTTDGQTLDLKGALNSAAGITGDWIVTSAEGVEDTSLQAIKIG